jgi:hypothetical protein
LQVIEQLIAVADGKIAFQPPQRNADNVTVMELGADALGVTQAQP